MSADTDCELLSVLNGHLENHQPEDALAALKNEKYREIVKRRSGELIPAISKHLSEEVSQRSPDLIRCCSELLLFIAQFAVPEDAIIEFIEQADCPNNDTLFIAVLEPLVTVHMRLNRRRCDSLKWLLNAILSHLRGFKAPEMTGLESADDRKLSDLDPAVIRINLIYSSIINCMCPLINVVSLGKVQDTSSLKEILISFILRLFGGPLSFLDLSYDGKFKSEARSNTEKLMHYFSLVSADMMCYLDQVEELHLKSGKKDSESTEMIDEHADCDVFSLEKIPEICYAVYYYILIVEKVDIDKIPFVYNHFYIFQCCVYLSTVLFNPKEDAHLLKGLGLAKSVVEMQVDSSVPCEALDSPVHSVFQKALMNAVVYSSSRECCSIGVKVLELYIKKFDGKGKYFVLMTTLSSSGHSGLAGFLLVQLKDILNGVITKGSADRKDQNTSVYFSGQNLLALLLSNGGCTLERGAETDILESSNQILSALNLLRFLAIRDNMNMSGFWDYVPTIRNKYLMPLREGIDLSRAHYQDKRKNLEEQKRLGRRNDVEKSDVNVKIMGMNLPNLPVDKKIFVVESALNTFDLIESVLGRLNECLEVGFLKK